MLGVRGWVSILPLPLPAETPSPCSTRQHWLMAVETMEGQVYGLIMDLTILQPSSSIPMDTKLKLFAKHLNDRVAQILIFATK
ncbi:hypothetical protein EV561_105175 [Rhizobium sp. BK376]|nr:hypothetical protein EV561_105175 [Rhizobium sp. BK376]